MLDHSRRTRRFTRDQIAAIMAKARMKKFPNIKVRQRWHARGSNDLMIEAPRVGYITYKIAKLPDKKKKYIYVSNFEKIGQRMSAHNTRSLIDAVLRSAVKNNVEYIDAYPLNDTVRRLMLNLGAVKTYGPNLRIPVRPHRRKIMNILKHTRGF